MSGVSGKRLAPLRLGSGGKLVYGDVAKSHHLHAGRMNGPGNQKLRVEIRR